MIEGIASKTVWIAKATDSTIVWTVRLNGRGIMVKTVLPRSSTKRGTASIAGWTAKAIGSIIGWTGKAIGWIDVWIEKVIGQIVGWTDPVNGRIAGWTGSGTTPKPGITMDLDGENITGWYTKGACNPKGKVCFTNRCLSFCETHLRLTVTRPCTL